MTKILVTGGAGYIGAHICKKLEEKGFDVYVIDNFSGGQLDFVQNYSWERVDLLDRPALLANLQEIRPQAVIHLAGKIIVSESVAYPELYLQNNVEGTQNLLEGLHEIGTKRLIFASSCAVFGEPKKLPIQENDLIGPTTPYGQSKWLAEELIRAHASKDPQFGYTIFRFFNASGADPSGQIGENHQPETHLIPNLIQSLLTGETLSIYGNDYPTPDGSCIRDYVHVNDIASAHLLALEKLLKEPFRETIHLGSSQGISIKELIALTEKQLGMTLKKRFSPKRAGDPPILIASIERATQLLGWHPQYSIQDILQSAYLWHRQFLTI